MIVGEPRLHRPRVLYSLVLMAAAVAQAQTAPTSAMAAVLAPVATPQPATAAAAAAGAAEPSFHGDSQRGKALYANCTSCHSIDDNDIGPKHRGVVGRKAGTAPGYAYSAALKGSGIVWNPSTLDRWLTNPSAMVPGTKMFFLVPDPQVRADIIAYLTELK